MNIPAILTQPCTERDRTDPAIQAPDGVSGGRTQPRPADSHCITIGSAAWEASDVCSRETENVGDEEEVVGRKAKRVCLKIGTDATPFD